MVTDIIKAFTVIRIFDFDLLSAMELKLIWLRAVSRNCVNMDGPNQLSG
jgi:hypothetical protein